MLWNERHLHVILLARERVRFSKQRKVTLLLYCVQLKSDSDAIGILRVPLPTHIFRQQYAAAEGFKTAYRAIETKGLSV